MGKVEFINQTENWLVAHDVIEPVYKLTPKLMQSQDINVYISSVIWMLTDKGINLVDEFKNKVNKSNVRGIKKLK